MLALAGLPTLALNAAEPRSQTIIPAALPPLLTTAEHRAALLHAAHLVDGPGMPSCPDAAYSTTGDIGILAPLQIAEGHARAGAWKETIQETGCGMTRLLNVLTTVQPDSTLKVEALLPGTTITDPQLQRDSVQYAAAGMGTMPPGCEQGGVLNTRFLGLDGQRPGILPAPGSRPRPWSEVWTLQACSKQADVILHFTPDAMGTEIRVDQPKQ
jgi:hypothetical protein